MGNSNGRTPSEQSPESTEERLIELVSDYHATLVKGVAATIAADTSGLDAGSLVELECAKRVLDRLHRVGAEMHAFSVDAVAALKSPASPDAHSIKQPAIPFPMGDTDAPDVPHQFGRFEIIRELGHGGLGVVFLARDPILRRNVALKIPRPEALWTREHRQRFTREAQAAARLTHPNIAAIYETGEVGPVCYIASAYCEGPNLAIWQKQTDHGLGPKEAASIVATLADAMQYAHNLGVLHRDLKPANILLEPSPVPYEGNGPTRHSFPFTPKITDFGLAKIEDLPDRHTRSGSVLGTPSYMAPEQAEGRLGDIDVRSDVYGLGATLFDLLTGRPPCLGNSDADTLRRVLTDEAEFTGAERRAIPADLRAICLKCLEKEAHRRYATAGALAKDLRRFLRDQPTVARPLGPLGRGLKWARRRPTTAALILVTLAAACTLVASSLWHSVQVTGLLEIAEQRRQEAEARKAEVEDKQRVLSRHLYAADVPLAFKAYQQNNISQMREILDRHIPHTGEDDIRSFAWHLLHKFSHAERLTLNGHTGDVYTVLYSPDGKLLASCGRDKTVRLWDAADGRPIGTLGGHAKEVNTIAFSPDGTKLASAGDDGLIQVWNIDAGLRGLSARDPSPWKSFSLSHSLPLQAATFSPDGNLLAAAGDDHAIELISMVSGEPRTITTDCGFACLLFSRDGKRLYSVEKADRGNRIAVFDSSSGRRQQTSSDSGLLTTLAISHDGKSLVAAQQDGQIFVWNARTLEQSAVLRSATRADTLEFSPDDRTLAVGGRDRTLELWDVARNKKVETLKGHTGAIWSAAFSPDGNSLATCSADGTVKVWNWQRSDPRRFSAMPPIGYTTATFSPDSQTVAAGTHTGTVEFWDWNAGRLLKSWQTTKPTDGPPSPTNAPDIEAIAFSPNGQQLASSYQDSVRLWNTVTGTLMGELCSGHYGVVSLSYSPDGLHLAVGATTPILRGVSRIWSLADRTTQPACWQLSKVPWIRYERSANVVAAVSEFDTFHMIRVSEPSDQQVFDLRMDGMGVFAVSDDGRLLAAGGNKLDKGIHLWETSTGRRIASLVGHQDAITSVGFAPDRRTLASASSDGTVRLWDLASHQELLVLESDLKNPVCCAFSPDGRALLTATGDGQILVWDAGVSTVPKGEATSHGLDSVSVASTSPTEVREITQGEQHFKEQSLFHEHFEWVLRNRTLRPNQGAIPTFEERVENGIVHHRVVVLEETLGKVIRIEPHPALEKADQADVREKMRAANRRDNLPQDAVAACVLGLPEWKVFPRSWKMIVLPKRAAEQREIAASELGATDDIFERFRGIHRWAKGHGFAGGFPTFLDEVRDGRPYIGAALIKANAGREEWMSAGE